MWHIQVTFFSIGSPPSNLPCLPLTSMPRCHLPLPSPPCPCPHPCHSLSCSCGCLSCVEGSTAAGIGTAPFSHNPASSLPPPSPLHTPPPTPLPHTCGRLGCEENRAVADVRRAPLIVRTALSRKHGPVASQRVHTYSIHLRATASAAGAAAAAASCLSIRRGVVGTDQSLLLSVQA